MIVYKEEECCDLKNKDLCTRDFTQDVFNSLPIEDCVYRGEGNANLVVAIPKVSFFIIVWLK